MRDHGFESSQAPSSVTCSVDESACATTTGSATFDMCYADWGASGAISDLSGNLQEWTATSPTAVRCCYYP